MALPHYVIEKELIPNAHADVDCGVVAAAPLRVASAPVKKGLAVVGRRQHHSILTPGPHKHTVRMRTACRFHQAEPECRAVSVVKDVTRARGWVSQDAPL
jgi:hypothetical protein